MKTEKKSKFMFWLPVGVSLLALALAGISLHKTNRMIQNRSQRIARMHDNQPRPNVPPHARQQRRGDSPKKEG